MSPSGAVSGLASSSLAALAWLVALLGLALTSLKVAEAQRAVEGRGRAFLRPSGTEPVVRVTVEADDESLVASTLERLAEAVRAAA